MTFWKKFFGLSGSRPSQSLEDFTVRFRIVSAPHGKWALEKSDVRFYRYVGPLLEWRTIGEYDSVEEAQADYRHVFCTPALSLGTGDTAKGDNRT